MLEKDEIIKREKTNVTILKKEINALKNELKTIAEKKYRKIDPSYESRKNEKTIQIDNTQDAIEYITDTTFQPAVVENQNNNVVANVNASVQWIGEETLNNMISENIPLPEEPYESAMGDSTMMNMINDSTLLPPTINGEENNEKCEFMMMGNYSKIHEENKTVNKYYDEINHSQADHPTSLYPKVIIQSKELDTHKRKEAGTDKQKSSRGKYAPQKTRELRVRQYDRSRSPPRCNRNLCKNQNNSNKKTDEARKGEKYRNDRRQQYNASYNYYNNQRKLNRADKSSYNLRRYDNHTKVQKIEKYDNRYKTIQQKERKREYEYRKTRNDENASKEKRNENKYENYKKYENPSKWKTRENHQNMSYTKNKVNETNRSYNTQHRSTSTVENAGVQNDKNSMRSVQTKVNNNDGNHKILYDLLEEIKKYINTDDIESRKDEERVPCRYYQQRRCKFGHQCKNLHVHLPGKSPSKPPSTPYSSQQL